MDLNLGLNHSVCLCITPASLNSILNSSLPSSAKRRFRKDISYVVALSPHDYLAEPSIGDEEEDIAGAGWRGYFNVAVESLLDDLFPTIAVDSRSPFELAGHVQGDDVWCDGLRWGVHKAGVGYWDRRTGRTGPEA